jgi:hypothetical protein
MDRILLSSEKSQSKIGQEGRRNSQDAISSLDQIKRGELG